MMHNKEIYRSDELYALLLEEEKKKPLVALKSCIPSLDSYIQDFRGGDITIISGKTGHGKTLFAQSLTANMSAHNHNILWFSYEERPIEFLRKMLIGEKPVLFYLPLHLIANKLDYIEFKLKEARKIVPIHAVFIDHLHYLCDLEDVKLSIEIGRVMRWLKEKAITYNVAIFLIAHVQKFLKIELNAIDNDFLKDSSSIAQDSDNVFFIYRDDKNNNRSILKITKNRRYGYRNKYIPLVKRGNFLYEEIKLSDDED